MLPIIDITKSLKLQQYMSDQKLDANDKDFIDKVNLSNLILKSDFDRIKNQVERYLTLKDNVQNNVGDIIAQSDEMKRLNNDIIADTGKDANQINLNDLDTVAKIDKILNESNIKSKNNLSVAIYYTDDCDYNHTDYVKVTLFDDKQHFTKYGIQSGARIALSNSGLILVAKKDLYMK